MKITTDNIQNLQLIVGQNNVSQDERLLDSHASDYTEDLKYLPEVCGLAGYCRGGSCCAEIL